MINIPLKVCEIKNRVLSGELVTLYLSLKVNKKEDYLSSGIITTL